MSDEVEMNYRNWSRKIRRFVDVQCCEELSARWNFTVKLLYQAERTAIQEAIETEYKSTRSCTLRAVHLKASNEAWTEIRIGISNQYSLDEWLVPAASTTRECASIQKASRKA
jgi:hypothetical protein